MQKTDDIQDKIDLLHQQVRKFIAEGYNENEINQKMKESGIEPGYTQLIFENIARERSDRKNFLYSLLLGFFLVISGIALNIISYRIAANSNSFVFYLFWGILVTGIVTIARGFILFRK